MFQRAEISIQLNCKQNKLLKGSSNAYSFAIESSQIKCYAKVALFMHTFIQMIHTYIIMTLYSTYLNEDVIDIQNYALSLFLLLLSV